MKPGLSACFAVLSVAFVLVLASCEKSAPAPEEATQKAPEIAEAPPNVVLISLDTLRPDHLGCYGYDRTTSPNLDEFAGGSVLFENAYCQVPWTLPSHMSLLTSMLPSHNRVEDINEQLSEDIPLLTQVLRANGYSTAALVNNGQIKAHWGFSRGFDLWREFEVDTPAGNCENVTAEALKWLSAAPDRPFFLFLHYYDPHDPYDPPPQYLERFNSTTSGQAAREIVWQHRYPGEDIKDPDLLAEIIGAYDGEIAWLDRELGKLFAALPPNTLTVVFSDHGEAFEEHGWTTHGAALYEEEVRVLLLVRRPDGKGRRVAAPVMLLDVAPTILGQCGIRPPAHYEGGDLATLMDGGSMPERPVLAETKRVLEGRVLKMTAQAPWKLIYSLFDGNVELYRLPDEQKDLSETHTSVRDEMLPLVRDWLEGEDFWMVHAAGNGTFEATLKTTGRFSVFIPVNFDMERDRLQPTPEQIRLTLYPQGGTKALYCELSPRDAEVTFSFKVNGEEFAAGPPSAQVPFIEQAFKAPKPGFYVAHHRGDGAEGRSPVGVTLDEQTIRQLRSLGYLE